MDAEHLSEGRVFATVTAIRADWLKKVGIILIIINFV